MLALLLLLALDEAPLDLLRTGLRDAKSPEEKARRLLAFGAEATPDAATVAELSRFLCPVPGDGRFSLPTASALVLARFRGCKAASQALERALPRFDKVPRVRRQLIAALARVGHEASQPALDALVRGSDADLSLFTLGVLRELPPDLSLDALIRSWEWIESRRSKAGDETKGVFNRLEAEILKQVQALSGERYPTMTEMVVWWSKHGVTWKSVARRRERERPPEELPAELPPALLFEFLFNERLGTSAPNTGLTSVWIPAGILTKNRPFWSTDVPPSGGAGSLDWGKEAGAVDVPGVAEHLRGLSAFSVTGWINVRSLAEGRGGNRLVSWLDRDGVEIVQRADGSLEAGIDQTSVRTPPGGLREIEDAVPNSVFDRWTFFAVTRDEKEVRIYLGARDRDAAPAATGSSRGGKTGSRIAAALSIGNLPPGARIAGGGFRGLIDELRIFGDALTPAEVVKVQNR